MSFQPRLFLSSKAWAYPNETLIATPTLTVNIDEAEKTCLGQTIFSNEAFFCARFIKSFTVVIY
jgi:hypothetical protein